jgi:hypothetical protein
MTNKDRFGWVNASYVMGLSLMKTAPRLALGMLTPWEKFEEARERARQNEELLRQRDDMNVIEEGVATEQTIVVSLEE